MRPIISVIHPTRRARKAWSTRRAWLNAADNVFHIEYITVVDQDQFPNRDRATLRTYRELGIYVSPGNTSVEANNLGASKAHGELLLMLSDDMDEPEPQWDLKLIGLLPSDWEEKPLFVGIGDSIHNPDGSDLFTIPCMNRKLYEKWGYFVEPRLRHYHVDDLQSWRARHDGVLFDIRKRLVFKHHRGTGVDEVYQRASTLQPDSEQVFKGLKEQYSCL